ncbi:MAG TPA: hypothetical protein PKY98_06620 [Sedimentibacter sp.]|nr:hypothetical protein [Sedimentibacter sp.]
MSDYQQEIRETFKEINNRPINQAVIKMEEKLNRQWTMDWNMVATAQAIQEALNLEEYWFCQQEVEMMQEIMLMGLTEGLYSRKDILKFQYQIIEAEWDENEPRIQVEDILKMKTLGEMNNYLLNQMEAILTEMSTEFSMLSRNR